MKQRTQSCGITITTYSCLTSALFLPRHLPEFQVAAVAVLLLMPMLQLCFNLQDATCNLQLQLATCNLQANSMTLTAETTSRRDVYVCN